MTAGIFTGASTQSTVRILRFHMTVAALYVLQRWYGHVAGKIFVTMVAMVVPCPIRAAGRIENIRLGNIAAAAPDGCAGEVAGGANCGDDMVLAHPHRQFWSTGSL